jgi:hypothetical protein
MPREKKPLTRSGAWSGHGEGTGRLRSVPRCADSPRHVESSSAGGTPQWRGWGCASASVRDVDLRAAPHPDSSLGTPARSPPRCAQVLRGLRFPAAAPATEPEPEIPFIQTGDPLGGRGRMGSVRSNHVGQQRAVSPAAATSRARSASAPACVRRTPLLPARLATRVRPAGRGWGWGRRGRGPRGGTRHPEGAALHGGARGVGSPAVPPATGGEVATPGTATCDRWPLRPRKTWAPPSPRGFGSGRRRAGARGVCAGRGCQSLYIFHTGNATKMAAASLFP